MIDLRGRRALVTGGSRGIGAATAQMLAAAGADVGIAYRNRADDAARVVGEIEARGVKSFAFAGDLADRMTNDAFVHEAITQFGGLDIYVANSGVWPPNPKSVGELDDDRWHHTINVNLNGLFYGVRAASRAISNGGRIVIVGSTAGQRGEAGHADYAATKGAVMSFVKSVAVELAPRDVNVNCVAPGWVDTDAVAVPFAGPGRARIESNIPLGRVASAADIAGPILFLVSPLARHVTGEVLNVNGGSVLCG